MKAILLTVAVFSLVAAAAAQEHPTVAAQPNTVFVGADGKFEAAPDTALLQFNISDQEPNPKSAYDHVSKSTEQVRQILRSNGIDPRQAEFGSYSLQPVFDYRSPDRKPVGYRVTASVSLKLRDFSKLSDLLDQLSAVPSTGNQVINYTLENMDAAKIKAVNNAYEHARAEAEALARTAGRTLGELSYASVDTFEQGPIRPMMGRVQMQAGAAKVGAPTEEFTPEKVTVTAHVNALFTIK